MLGLEASTAPAEPRAIPVGVVALSVAAPSEPNDAADYDMHVMRTDGSRSRLVVGIKGVHEYQAAWSPDGSWLAFTRLPRRTTAGQSEIWLIRADGSAKRRLVSGNSPAWAPDGRRIAFSRGGVVRILDLRSGAERRLTSGHAPSWSSRGLIAFVRGATDLYGAGARSTIWVARPDGSGLRRLLSGVAGHGGPVEEGVEKYNAHARGPVWSPDGRRIAFFNEFEWSWDEYGQQGSTNMVQVADADGTGRETICPEFGWSDVPGAPGDASRLSWAPTGRWIAVADQDPQSTVRYCATVRPFEEVKLRLGRRGTPSGVAWRPR